MSQQRAGVLPWLVGLAMLGGLGGCHPAGKRPEPDTPLPDITPTSIDYTDNDAFDAVFESALVNQDPVIAVSTGRQMPDWGARLNAWIAAWNQGGKDRGRTARGQAGLPKVVIDGDSIREFRLLVSGLLDRIEEAAQAGSTWYADQRQRSRRIALLRPYNLRFHKDEAGTIQLIFFHGNYAPYYPRFVQKLMRSPSMPASEWSRVVECSACRAEPDSSPTLLTSRGKTGGRR